MKDNLKAITNILEYTIIGAGIGYLGGYPITGAIIGGAGRAATTIGKTTLEWFCQGYPMTKEPIKEFKDDMITELSQESYPEKIIKNIYERITYMYDTFW